MRQRNITRFLSSLLILLLLLSGASAPPARAQEQAITVDLAITTATVDVHTGDVTVTGTVTCSEAASGFVGAEVTQQVGRLFTVRGWGGTEVNCGPTPTSFTFTVESYQGEFRPGKANIRANSYVQVYDPATDRYRYGSDTVETTLRLRGV